MISLIEANQAWLEQIAYQMCSMSYAQQSKLLGGPIGLLKSFATRSAHEVADEAVNIFGGRGLTQSGMGRVVEMFHRTYKFDAILGGTEVRRLNGGTNNSETWCANFVLGNPCGFRS
jgi:alkylation response protein AidB-like acyl-CoA dehydrogenase